MIPEKKLGYLDDDTLNYYRQVSETLENGFPNEEEKDLFMNNALGQLSQEALKVSQNQTGSRIAERLIKEARPHHTCQVFTALSQDWDAVTTDRFASHVLQSLIHMVPSLWSGSENTADDVFTSLYDYVKENLETVISDTYGSHIVRQLIESLGGVTVSDLVIRSQVSRRNVKGVESKSQVTNKADVPDTFKKKLKKLAKQIFKLCNYEEHLLCVNFNSTLQTVLLVLHQVDEEQCATFCRKIIKKSGLQLGEIKTETKSKTKTKLPELVQDKTGSFLVEQLIAVATPGELAHIYSSIFKGRLLHFTVDKIANYVLQKLLSCVSDKTLFMEIFDELSPFLEDTFAVGHVTVVIKLAEACLRVGTRQDRLIKVLMESFHCAEPPERQTEFVKLLASLTTYDVFFGQIKDKDSTEEKTKPLLTMISLKGSLLLQHLLQFGKPKLVITSLLQLQPAELVTLCCDQTGSHIIDAFFQSQSVGEKNCELMVDRLKGSYVEIACNRNGSRALEAIWRCVPTKLRCVIAEELTLQESRLRGDQYGGFVHRNFAISHFKQRRADWKNLQGAATKKRKLFQDIFDDKDSPASKRGKKNESSKSKDVDTVAPSLELQESDDEKVNNTAVDVLLNSMSKKSENMEPSAKQKKHSKRQKDIPSPETKTFKTTDKHKERKKKKKDKSV